MASSSSREIVCSRCQRFVVTLLGLPTCENCGQEIELNARSRGLRDEDPEFWCETVKEPEPEINPETCESVDHSAPSRPVVFPWSRDQLVRHLGSWGIFSPQEYGNVFGEPSDQFFFGENIVNGMMKTLAEYWSKKCAQFPNGGPGCINDLLLPVRQPGAYEPWFGVFQCPVYDSSEMAMRPVSRRNPLSGRQLPAVFYLSRQQHAENSELARPAADIVRIMKHLCDENVHQPLDVQVKTIAVQNFADHNATFRQRSDDGGLYVEGLHRHYQLPADRRLIQVHHSTSLEGNRLFKMVSLKNAVDDSWSWSVNLDFVRLLGPMSSL